MRAIFLAAIGILLLSSPIHAQDWSVDDLLSQEMASTFVFSPDGSSVVWVKRRPSKEKDRFVGDLWLTPPGKPSIPLTPGDDSEHSPFFSSDGKTLYFLSDRGDGNTLWSLSLYGGEAVAVHSFEHGFSDPKWIDPTRIAFLADEGELRYTQAFAERGDRSMVIEDTTTFVPNRVFSFDVVTKQIRRLTSNETPIQSYGVSKDGKHLVTAHVNSVHYEADAQPAMTTFLWSLADGSRKPILSGYQEPTDFQFPSDHSGFFFIATRSIDPEWGGYGVSDLHFHSFATGQISKVNQAHEWGLAFGYHVIGTDVIASLANGPTLKTGIFSRDGSRWTMTEVGIGADSHHGRVAAMSDDSKSAVVAVSRATHMPRYHLASLTRDRRSARLTLGGEVAKLNAHLASKSMPKAEVIWWTGALGDKVSGILYYPDNYTPGRRYPLMLAIHGGPSEADIDEWYQNWGYYPKLLTQRGSFVLLPNYHGSSNHGFDFNQSIKDGKYYDLPVEDMVTAIHHLRDEGKVDMDSLGVMGWSNGAIIGIELTVRYPTMFKVLGSGAGDVNWTSDYGTCQFGVRFNNSYFGDGAPWDDLDGKAYNQRYIDMSPFFELDKVITPTILFFGSEDRAVPRDQGWEHHRALQQIGKAPVKFLWFPGMEHSLTLLSYQKRKIEEELAWFDRYFFGTHVPENAAYKEDSPLGRMFALNEAKRDGGLFGERNGGHLIPESVPTGTGISVGRFEVTNAQFQSFRPTHEFGAGYANHPVTGLTLDDIQAYLGWLSAVTGQTYRLPDSKEAEEWNAIAVEAGPRELTLNQLAGYPLSVLDAPALRAKAMELAPEALIRAVGQHPPSRIGEAQVYDLGGNVAERHAQGVYGYSAIDYVDSAAPEARYVAPAFTGFRVVRE